MRLEAEPTRLNAGPHELYADRWNGGQELNVLLLHGLGGNSVTWHGVAPELAEQLSAQVLAVDLPGFGASRPGRHRVSVGMLCEVLARVMQNEPAPGAPWVLAGNSLGGVLALELACRFPSRVHAVNLAALALPLDWGRARPLAGFAHYLPIAVPWQGRRLVARYIQTRGLPGVVDDPIRFLFRDPARLDAELRQRLIGVSQYRITWAEEAARAYEQATRSLGLRLLVPKLSERRIRDVRCPVQAIYGTHDPLFPESAWQRLARTRPDWSYVQMKDIGHVPQLEAPSEFAAHMLSWLAEQTPLRAAS